MKERDIKYHPLCNEDGCIIAFVLSTCKNATVHDLLSIAARELELDAKTELDSFNSYIEYGFYAGFDGQRYNGWSIRNMYKPVNRKSNSVKVLVVKEKEI